MDKEKRQLIVLGGGPGGYTAAFYAADRGLEVTLVDDAERLGGVCMNHGCIPSKALLQTTEILEQRQMLKERGIHFDEPRIHLKSLNDWKNGVVEQLGKGLHSLAKARGIEYIRGRGTFSGENLLRVETDDGQAYFSFDHLIIATGSRVALPGVFDIGNPRVMTSREALEVDSIPESLLVIGGGYIGLELGSVYARLGSRVSVVEATESLLPGTDKDLVAVLESRLKHVFHEIVTGAEVSGLATSGERIDVAYTQDEKEKKESFDKVLVAIGRVPNSEALGLGDTGIKTDDQQLIEVDQQGRTNNRQVFAIGDVCREPMLAHAASKEARVAVEAILGEASSAEDFIVPAIVYTDPEIAWCGISEAEAEDKGLDVKTVSFPWKASGRALTHGRTEGLTKLIVDARSERLLGAAICGHGAADLIAEAVLALEMGAGVKDLAESIHPHPTLSETLKEAAEHFYSTATHHVAKPG